MKFWYLYKAVLAASLFLLSSGLSPAQEPTVTTPATEELVSVVEALNAVEGIEDLFNSCPADIANTRQSFSTWIFGYKRKNIYEFCEENIGTCASSCIDEYRPNSCFYTARILEDYQEVVPETSRRKAYALACAMGAPSGCTNRAANMLNVYSDEDIWSTYGEEKLNPCVFKTFANSCKAGDSWGCAMSGQTYQLGRGVDVNFVKARSLYERACELASTEKFASCVFAKKRLEDIAVQSNE